MSLVDTADQRALAAAVRSLVTDHSPMSAVRRVVEDGLGFDPAVWSRLAELGVAGLTLPEEHGGSGGSQGDLAAVLRELGYGLVPSPLLSSSVLAANVLLLLDDEPVKKELLPQLAAGEVVATLAGPGDVRATDDGVLDGAAHAVLHGGHADVLLIPVRPGGVHLVRAGAPGLTVTPEPGLDGTLPTATVAFRQTPAALVAGDADVALARVADLANVAVAAWQSGALRRALEVTTGFAKNRYSFGLPIGSYQGVKHKLADVYTDWCLVDAATRRAVEALDGGEPDASACAAASRLLAGPAYVNGAKRMMTLHGGIGFTWEHDAHLFYKNAVTTSVLLGGLPEQRSRLADLLGLSV